MSQSEVQIQICLMGQDHTYKECVAGSIRAEAQKSDRC